MIKTQGTLRIKKIRHSRNGAFCVADLITDFGEFKVKDPLLDQFEEGEYEGKVWISEIYLSQYIAYGKAVTEMRARLHDLLIQTEDHVPVGNEPLELDPLDEQQPPAAAAVASAKKDRPDKPKHREPTKAKGDAGQPASPLFNDELQAAIAEGESVKLDPTVDRALLRTQAAELRRLGYQFRSKEQVWHLSPSR